MTTRLYYHQTDGGAEYLCASPVEGTDEGDLYTAVIRLDGEPELLDASAFVDVDQLKTIYSQLQKAWGRAHYEEIRVAMQTTRAIIQKAEGK